MEEIKINKLALCFVVFALSSSSPLSANAGRDKLSASAKTNKEMQIGNNKTYETEVIYYTFDELVKLNKSVEELNSFELSVTDDEIKTFDDKKVFSGTADSAAQITASIYIKGSQDSYVLQEDAKELTVTVGKSSLFSINVDLVLGESLVVIKGVKDSKSSTKIYKVNRKSVEIKETLKNSLKESTIKLNN